MANFKVLFGALFVILAFAVMFSDAMIHLKQKDKTSMVFLHSQHSEMEGMDHDAMESIGHETIENNGEHATMDSVMDCFGHHDIDESSIKHCQEEICGTGSHCYEEVLGFLEEMGYDVGTAAMGSMDHEAMEGMDNSMMQGHLTTFGPGLTPHIHALNMSTFAKIEDIAKDPSDMPPPLNRDYEETVYISLRSTEVISEIAPDITYHYWTFNNTIPGPMLRVREGDTVVLTLENDETSSHNHSIDLHAVTGPGGGATLTQVTPGESKTIKFKALNPGTFVYHCATPNVPMHMTNGMYGMIIVEPKERQPVVDKEFYVMQGELYTAGQIGETGFQEFDPNKMLYENPEYVLFNGRVKSLVDHPLTANVDETVRIYFGNGGVSFISSFHVIGEIFDRVYAEASSHIHENVQTTAVPAGGATVTEFKLNTAGNYILVDHALARLEKGAWGILKAEGEEDPEVYSEVK